MDRREAILARLAEIAEGLTTESDPLVQGAGRNENTVSDSGLPAIMVLEGDEEVDPDETRINRPSDRPQLVHMLPQILIIGAEKRSELGPTLNAIRAVVIKAVTSDADLKTLAGIKHAVHYHGMQSDLAFAREMVGRFSLRFLIKYWLEPAEL